MFVLLSSSFSLLDAWREGCGQLHRGSSLPTQLSQTLLISGNLLFEGGAIGLIQGFPNILPRTSFLGLDLLVTTARCSLPEYDCEAWFPRFPVSPSQASIGPVPI